MFLISSGLLQYKYLKKHNASFAEHFYNLQRVPVTGEKFQTRHRNISLIILVILPYLYRKLGKRMSQYQLDDADGYFDNVLVAVISILAVNVILFL